MFDFLSNLDPANLKKAVLKDKGIDLNFNLYEKSNYGYALFSVYGFDLLKSAPIRRLLLQTLSEEEIDFLYEEAINGAHKNYFEKVLFLSKKTINSSTNYLKYFTELLEIPEEFLPSRNKAIPVKNLLCPISNYSPLFDYQSEVKDKVIDFLSSEKKITMVQMPTGSGKTKTIVESICSRLNADEKLNIIWLAHTEELCDQAVTSFDDYWLHHGTRNVSLYRFWGGHDPSLTGRKKSNIIVFSYNKFLNYTRVNSFDELSDSQLIVVVDEAHKALGAEINRAILNIKKIHQSKIIGLTATPGRGGYLDLESYELSRFFDKEIIYSEKLTDDPIRYLQSRGILSRAKKEVLKSDINLEIEYGFNDISPKTLKILSHNYERNKIILEKIISEVERSSQVLVFCCSVEHSRQLSVELSLTGIMSISIDCNMSRSGRRSAINLFKDNKIRVIFNYGVLSTGFDAPGIDTVIIARPTSSIVLYSQMIGRGLRGTEVGGSENCKIVDVRDNLDKFGDLDEVYNNFNSYW